MQFEWDEDKDRINKAKHGVSFETATRVWDDPHDGFISTGSKTARTDFTP
jgi:uncharacterized DUF497 family protein